MGANSQQHIYTFTTPCIFTQVIVCASLSLCPSVCPSACLSLSLCLFFQLMDVSHAFQSTEIEFLKSALHQPGGSIQAICVRNGAVARNIYNVLLQ